MYALLSSNSLNFILVREFACAMALSRHFTELYLNEKNEALSLRMHANAYSCERIFDAQPVEIHLVLYLFQCR